MAHESYPGTDTVEADSEQASQGVETGQDAGVEDPAKSSAQQIDKYRMNSDGTVEIEFDKKHKEEAGNHWAN